MSPSSPSNLILWPIESQLCFFYTLFHYTLTNIWQDVSVAAFLAASQPYLVPQQIESEWSCTFAVQAVSHFMSKRVSSAIVLDRLISAHPMNNSK